MGMTEAKADLENAVAEYNFCMKKCNELMPRIQHLSGKIEAYREMEQQPADTEDTNDAEPLPLEAEEKQ